MKMMAYLIGGGFAYAVALRMLVTAVLTPGDPLGILVLPAWLGAMIATAVAVCNPPS